MISNYTSDPSGLPYVQQVYENFTPKLQWSQNLLIGIVLQGSLQLNYDNHSREFNEHDIFFFLPFETFSIISTKNNAKILVLSVDYKFVETLVPDLTELKLQKHHFGKDLRNNIYYQICCDFSNIIFNNLKKEICSKFKMLNAITNMLIAILETYGEKSAIKEQRSYATKRIIDILNFINEHYTEKISIADISSKLGIHSQYFSAFFSKHFHSSFIEYLTAFRVNASLNQLIYSNDSILDIALSNGFSNHKTYASAFRKLYNMSPTEYRKLYAIYSYKESEMYMDSEINDEDSMFSYFRQFLTTDSSAKLNGNKPGNKQLLSFEPDKLLPNSYIKKQEHFCTLGRAFTCLRSDLQKQLAKAKKDLHIEHFRIRDIFSDSLYVYYEAEDKEPIYLWKELDTVFDVILSTGAKPFPEIGYMPEKLASKKQYAALNFRPNVSFPKSLKKWQDLIRNFLLHYIDRYGMEEVSSWYFDFWTSPDLQLKMAYWNETMERFFEFYKATYDVFQEINPELRLGSPNFSTISGFPWYEAFFDYCKENNISPAYVSIHAYGCTTEGSAIISTDLNDINVNEFSITNQNQVYEYLSQLHNIMKEKNCDDLEVIVSDFNLNFMPEDLIRDTCYMGPFLAHSTFLTMKQVKALGHWCLSDIHEDAYPKDAMFWGGPGYMNYNGLKKASYNALQLLGRMGDTILEQGKNYLLVKKDSIYQLYIYNLVEFEYFYMNMEKSALSNTHRYNIYSHNESLYFNIIMRLPKGTYYIQKFEVNRDYGSAYDIWGQMGYPKVFSKGIENHLRESSVPRISFSVQDIETALVLDEKVPAHGVLLLEIEMRQQ